MTTALEKVLAHAEKGTRQAVLPLDPASELVLAALALTDELQVLLGKGNWDDDDDDSGGGKGGGSSNGSSKGSNGSSGGGGGDDDEDDGDDQMAAMVAKLVKKGVPKAQAIQMAKKAAKQVKASALAEGIAIALSNLNVAEGTLDSVRERMAAATLPRTLALTVGSFEEEQEIRLAVLSAAERRKPSAHTISGSEDYPIPDAGHLTAAVARYKQGALAGHSKSEVRSHICSRARALGKNVEICS